MRNLKSGIILAEICIVVAIVTVATTVVVPGFTKITGRTKTQACIRNLEQLQLAKEQWALDYSKSYTSTPSEGEISSYIRGESSSLWCPLDKTKTFSTSYIIKNIGTRPVCKLGSGNHILVGGGFVAAGE